MTRRPSGYSPGYRRVTSEGSAEEALTRSWCLVPTFQPVSGWSAGDASDESPLSKTPAGRFALNTLDRAPKR